VHAIVSSTPCPSEREPTRGIEARVQRRIVHRGFRRDALRFALMGCRREGREAAAAVRSADVCGLAGFFDGAEVRA